MGKWPALDKIELIEGPIDEKTYEREIRSLQKKLLEDPGTQKIPILLMTAQKQLEQIFSNAGNVVGFIAKPFNIMELQQTIQAHLKE